MYYKNTNILFPKHKNKNFSSSASSKQLNPLFHGFMATFWKTYPSSFRSGGKRIGAKCGKLGGLPSIWLGISPLTTRIASDVSLTF